MAESSLSGVGSGIDTSSPHFRVGERRLWASERAQDQANVDQLGDLHALGHQHEPRHPADRGRCAEHGQWRGQLRRNLELARDRDQHLGQRAARCILDERDTAGQGAAHVLEHLRRSQHAARTGRHAEHSGGHGHAHRHQHRRQRHARPNRRQDQQRGRARQRLRVLRRYRPIACRSAAWTPARTTPSPSPNRVSTWA